MEQSPVRLNLGCGNKIREGWINVDFESNYSGKKPDVSCDLRKLPFPDNYADEIEAVHVLEHFLPWETGEVLDEWIRVLKPSGTLAIEVPCFEKVMQAFVDKKATQAHWFALYGDWRYGDEKMLHRWCFTRNQLLHLMGERLGNVREETAKYHVPSRDMRVVGGKS